MHCGRGKSCSRVSVVSWQNAGGGGKWGSGGTEPDIDLGIEGLDRLEEEAADIEGSVGASDEERVEGDDHGEGERYPPGLELNISGLFEGGGGRTERCLRMLQAPMGSSNRSRSPPSPIDLRQPSASDSPCTYSRP